MLCYQHGSGQNYLASYLSEQKALASHWLDELANSILNYLTTDQSYAASDY
jgi:hypothetical protein